MAILRDIFWDMNKIEYWLETIELEKPRKSFYISEWPPNSDMAAEYGFNAEQVKMLNELMQDEYRQLFMRLTGSYVDIALSPK